MTALTVADLDRAEQDDRWAGWGWLGERAHRRYLDPADGVTREVQLTVAAIDQRVIDHANASGWTYEDLFHWANSKYGRWIADMVFGSADPFSVAWARVEATTHPELLPTAQHVREELYA